MSDNELPEEAIWEYKSLRKTKPPDSHVERSVPQEKPTKAGRLKQRVVRRAGLSDNTKNTKKNQPSNGNTTDPSTTRDQNKISNQDGNKQSSQSNLSTPTKKKPENKKQSPRTPQPRNDGYCPSCQMPFSLLLVQTPRWHVSECLDTPVSTDKECPDGVMCNSTIPSHYKRYTHFQLAQSRDTDDSLLSAIQSPAQLFSGPVKSNISTSVNEFENLKSVINTLHSSQNGHCTPAFSNKNRSHMSPKSKSQSSSQSSVKCTSLDAWLSPKSKSDKVLTSVSQESLNISTELVDTAAKTSGLSQQAADLSDCEISYSPLAIKNEVNSDDDIITSSAKKLFFSDSSEDSFDGTEDKPCERQLDKDKEYSDNPESGMIKAHDLYTEKYQNNDIRALNAGFAQSNRQSVCESSCVVDQPQSAHIPEHANWTEYHSPASEVNEQNTYEFEPDWYFDEDFDDRFANSPVQIAETSVSGNFKVEASSCVSGRDQGLFTNPTSHLQTLPNTSSGLSSAGRGEEGGLSSTQKTLNMPSKTLQLPSSAIVAPSKGKKQMDIGVFFGLKPKANVEKDEIKLPLKPQSQNHLIAPSERKPVQRKRKAEGSIGDTEALGDNTNTLGAAGSQRRGGKRFRQSSTAEEGRGKKQCPFYKKIPGTGFTVDAFQYGEIEGCSAYFLTHFHSDHYGGLTKKFRFPIYCSKITGNLVQSKLRVEKEFINTLPMNTECVVNNIRVVLLDANHCPGAVLLLFCLPDGTMILHTGDFRADPSMEKYPALIGKKIHSLYLDTTYLSPEYTFPPQQEAVCFAATTAFEMVTLHPRTLVVCGTYSVGKEKVFLAIAEILGCKVSMSQDKYKTMQCLESEEIRSMVTTDWNSTALHVLPMMQVNFKGLNIHLNKFSGKYDRVLAFKPTGWTYSERCDTVANIKPDIRGKVTVYGIPYSEHSSYSEMKRFVQWLKPQKIIPTVNVGSQKSRTTMEKYFSEWLSEGAQKSMRRK
ncbi:DNA cross-link repair 1A protein [Rhinophrynus dorsalis]